MQNMDDYRDNFSRKLDQMKAQHGQNGAESESMLPELSDGVKRWEARLESRLEEYLQSQPAAPGSSQAVNVSIRPGDSPFGPGVRLVRPDPTYDFWCQTLQDIMLTELEFGRFQLPAGFSAPVFWVEEADSLRQAAAQASGLAAIPETSLENSGIFHYPGKGTLINLAHYLQSSSSGTDRLQRAQLIGDLAWERWGWGFLLEYTALGKWAGSRGLWPALSAQRLGVLPGDDPAFHLAAALRRSWLLLETGWMDWVWHFVEFKARQAVGTGILQAARPGRTLELLNKIVNLFPFYITPYGIRMRLLNLIDLARFLFVEESGLLTTSLHQVLQAVQKYCLENDARIAETIGQRLSQLLGRMYFARLEAAVGVLSTPYAVLIAMHVPSLPVNPTAATIMAAIESDPLLSADTRLALLTGSDAGTKYDPRVLFVSAWEHYKLDGPREYFP